MHVIIELLYSALLGAGALAAVDIGLYLAWLGNPRQIHFATKIRRFLDKVPPGTTFNCKGTKVSATFYDPGRDEERTIDDMYRTSEWFPSFLDWSGGSRATPRMKRAAANEIWLHLCFFAL